MDDVDDVDETGELENDDEFMLLGTIRMEPCAFLGKLESYKR